MLTEKDESILFLPNGWYIAVRKSEFFESECDLYDPNDTLLMSGAMMHPEKFVEDMWSKTENGETRL